MQQALFLNRSFLLGLAAMIDGNNMKRIFIIAEIWKQRISDIVDKISLYRLNELSIM